MGKGNKARKRTQPRHTRALWWIAGIALFVLAAGGSFIYLARPGATAGPKEAAVSQFEHVHGLAVDPSRPEVLWIGTHGSLIRATGGKEWLRIGAQRYDMMGFNVHPTEPNVLVTSGHPGSTDRRPNPLGIEISRDGGQSWQPLAMAGLADFHAMTISRADSKVFWAWNVSGRPGLYRSQDGGRHWEYLGDPLGGAFYLSAHPQRANVVFAGTGRGLAMSDNAGGSWRLFSPSLTGVPVTAVEVHPKNPQIMYAYAVRPDLGLIRSEDGGKQWISTGFFLGDRNAISNLALDLADPQILYSATHSGEIYRLRDGGKTRERWVSGGRVVAP